MQKRYVQCLTLVGSFLFSATLVSIAPTREEKDLLRLAKERHHHGMRSVVDEVKRGWGVIEYFHPLVRLNNKIHTALSDRWQRAYSFHDAPGSLKITERDILSIYEEFLLELHPTISYFSKQRALSKMRHDARIFIDRVQSEFRSTVESAQHAIMMHLKDHIPREMYQKCQEATDQVISDGIRFLIYVILQKHNNGFNRYDVRFINARLDLLRAQMNREFPYIAVSMYESWAFSLIQDLLFADCVVCMDHKADRYMACCKTKSICRTCYHRVTSCPLCRAPKRPRSRS